MTGADYLLTLSSQAADQGMPYACEFARMVQAAAMGGQTVMGSTFLEILAGAPLKDYEAAPASIIAGALRAAAARRDEQAGREIADFGLALLAKWPRYLAATTTGHPDLVRRE